MRDAGSQSATGSQKLMVVPWPAELSARIAPLRDPGAASQKPLSLRSARVTPVSPNGEIRSGLGIRKYCQQQRLTENTLGRWLKRLAGNETALKLDKYQTDLRRERAREEREEALRKQKQRRFTITSDVRNRASQAF